MRVLNQQPVLSGYAASRRLQGGAKKPEPDGLELPFAGLWLFTLLLYVRPNGLFPGLFGEFPLAKIVAIITVLAYLGAQLARGGQLTIWTIELKMSVAIWCLGLLFLPLAAAPGETWEMIIDTYLKVVIVFFLLVNLLVTRARLGSILKLVVVWGTVLAIDAVYRFAVGDYIPGEERIRHGIASGMFGNPNDLAIAFNLLLPLAVALALAQRGWRRIFYFACAAAMGMGVVATFSRAGFLGLVATGAVLAWKMGRSKRLASVLGGALLLGALLVLMPSQYSNRLSTIVASEKDATGSAQERQQLFKRAILVALRNPLTGVGMGNFHIYSVNEKVAHNSYLEIAAELGLAGLAAYLVLIFAPLRSMQRIEHETKAALAEGTLADAAQTLWRKDYYLSIALQASFVAYMVCTFFASVQYQWFVYYIAAYAMALRHIRDGAPSGALQTTTALAHRPPLSAVQPRTRLGVLSRKASE